MFRGFFLVVLLWPSLGAKAKPRTWIGREAMGGPAGRIQEARVGSCPIAAMLDGSVAAWDPGQRPS